MKEKKRPDDGRFFYNIFSWLKVTLLNIIRLLKKRREFYE